MDRYEFYISLFSVLLPVVGFLISALLSIGKTKNVLENCVEDIAELKEALRDSEGQNIYMTKRECSMAVHACQNKVCNELLSLKELIKQLDEKREKSKDHQSNELKEIMIFMGQVKQYLSEHT